MTRHIIPTTVKQAIRDVYAWPGGYPLFIVMTDGGCLCCACAKKEYRQIADSTVKGSRDGWDAAAADINWEDTDLTCDHCNKAIESAYGESSCIEVTTENAPSHWASYLINDDSSGMEDADIAECDAWLEFQKPWYVVSNEDDDSGNFGQFFFRVSNRWLGTDLVTYILHKKGS